MGPNMYELWTPANIYSDIFTISTGAGFLPVLWIRPLNDPNAQQKYPPRYCYVPLWPELAIIATSQALEDGAPRTDASVDTVITMVCQLLSSKYRVVLRPLPNGRTSWLINGGDANFLVNWDGPPNAPQEIAGFIRRLARDQGQWLVIP